MNEWWSGLDPRIALSAGGLPSAAIGIWVVWQWWIKRRDDREEQYLSREDRRTQELDRQQAAFEGERSEWFAKLRAENSALSKENDDLELKLDNAWKSSNRWEALARYWYGTAHDVLRLYRNLRHNALNMQQWIQSAVRLMRDYRDAEGKPLLRMPEAIDPVPDKSPELPMGLEDPK